MRRRDRQSRFKRRTERAVANRRVFPLLAGATALVAIGAGVLGRVIAQEDFPTVGDGVWWAIVTLGTVGYGDIVPVTVQGRLLGAGLIIFGVTFISFLTATVTSLFVAADQDDTAQRLHDAEVEEHHATRAALERLEERLVEIESRLEPRKGDT